jgi:hypothetical protein
MLNDKSTGGFSKAEAPSRVLDAFDRAVLDARAVPPVIRDDDESYYTETSEAEIAKLGKFLKGAAPALVMIGHCLDGSTFVQLRPHTPVDGRKALFPAGGGGRMHVSGPTRQHADNPRRPILANESIPKTDATALWPDEEVFSLGFGGSYGWRGPNRKGGRTVIDDLRSEEIAWVGVDDDGREFGRDFYVCFDGNVTTNPRVAEAAKRLAAFVRSKRANLHIIGLPGGLGIDDWRAANPDATFADLKALELKEEIDTESISYQASKVKLEQRFCVISNGWGIYDKTTGQQVDLYTLKTLAAAPFKYTDADGKERSTALRWLADETHEQYTSLILTPGAVPANHLNIFKGFAINEAAQGDVTWWKDLLSYVIPDKVVRDEIERALTWGLAHPDQWKTYQVPVIIGDHGIGKDLIGEFICAIIGERHSARLTNEHVKSQFDGFLKDALFVKFEELSTDRSVSNKVKKWTTSPTHELNPKYGKPIIVPNRTNFFGTSNDKMPIYIGSNSERRYLIYGSPAETMPEPMVAALVARLSDPAALSALLFHIRHGINFEGYNPRAPAMKTEAFYELADSTSLSDIDRWVQRLIDNPPEPLGQSDIWQSSEVAPFLPDEHRRGPGSETALTRSMGALRFRHQIQYFGLISVQGAKLRLWAVRNGPEWKAKGNGAVAAEYARMHPEVGRKQKRAKYDRPEIGPVDAAPLAQLAADPSRSN